MSCIEIDRQIEEEIEGEKRRQAKRLSDEGRIAVCRRGERIKGFQKLTKRKTKNVNSLSACLQK
jgi:hypothetical protein